MAWYIDLWYVEFYREMLKPVFGNHKNYQKWLTVRQDNINYNWLIWMGWRPIKAHQ